MNCSYEWPIWRIEECCDILDNRRIPVNSEERENRIGHIPYYGANGLQGYIDDFIFDEPLILIAEDGGRFDEFATRPIAYQINGKSWVNNHAHVLRAKKGYSQDAIFYVLEHKDIQPFIVGGTRSKLNQSALRSITFSLPEQEIEQCKIAEILSTVDQVIKQTGALIAKQQRIKTGLMQDLLTRGIDKDGKRRLEGTHEFKDSPLGRIPVEWDVKELKHLAKIVTGNKDTQNRNDSADYPFFVRSQQVERIGSYSFDGEAILTAGDGVGTGKVFHYINGKFDFHQRVYCLHSFDSKLDGFFFFNFFQTNFRNRVTQFSAKGSVDSVRLAMIADMLIPLPDLEEQRRSAAIIREAETVLSEYRKRSEKLKVLKTALMRDLLTGKVSVTQLLTAAEISI